MSTVPLEIKEQSGCPENCYSIKLNGVEVSHYLSSLRFEIEAGKPARLIAEAYVGNINLHSSYVITPEELICSLCKENCQLCKTDSCDIRMNREQEQMERKKHPHC